MHGARIRMSRGFTLFEVMISLLILTVAILSTLALLPVGLKALQLSRSQMFAAATAINLGNSFHNAVPKLGLGQISPTYVIRAGAPASTVAPPSTVPDCGWAAQMRNSMLQSSPYQYNAEQDLGGWFKGVLPVPIQIARRLDSTSDEIQNLLDQGGMLWYPDPNFMTGLNSGAALDKTLQTMPSSEIQKLVFAFASLPQQNLLTSHPVESLPWYEVYPFPPAWLSMEAKGIEARRLGDCAGPIGVKTAVTVRGRGTGDWTWCGGMVSYDDAGHSRYEPVYWRVPTREGAVSDPVGWGAWFNKEKPLDDPAAYNVGSNGGANDWDKGWYQGCAFHHGRNWRYFSINQGGLWKGGNGVASVDPFYAANAAQWAYICFQRLSGGDAQWLGCPRANYTRTIKDDAVGTLEGVPNAYTTIIDPIDPPLAGGDIAPAWNSTVVAVPPQNAWPAHTAAKFCRAGWLPIRGLQDNPTEVRFDDTMGNFYLADGNLNQGTLARTIQPQTCRPTATYEMRANYRDRAIDLWQAVMPSNSGLTTLTKNVNALVEVEKGGTMVDCDKYEYPPLELNKFKFMLPSQLDARDWPIHPAQVMALSYLAHAAMLVTGYSAPFAQDLTQSAQVNSIKIAWEGLNWTYRKGPQEAAFTEVAPGQGITKDALIVAADAAPGATTITIKNDTSNPYVLYPGDVITFAESYKQWWFRYGLPQRGNGDIWSYREAATMAGGIYDNPPVLFPNMNYRLHTFRVVSFNGNVGMPNEVGGNSTVSITITPPLPTYPANLNDATANPVLNNGVSVFAGSQIRRLCNEADRAFARKAYEMCMAWAQAYCSEEPYDCGAPRMANHQTMMDKPIAMFDLFWDAANGAANSPNGRAVRTPMNYQQWANNPMRYSTESFYRWMVPNNNVPDSYFWKGIAPLQNRHDISHSGPTTWGAPAWDMMTHNDQLKPPTDGNDQQRFWAVKPFAPFHRSRQLAFWSVDWKAFEDAEVVPSAPVDYAKQNMQIYNYWYLFPNGGLNAVNTFCGIPESLYAWTNPLRTTRFVDVASSEEGGQLWQNAQGMVPNDNPWAPPGADKVITFDTRMGHWGADRNGNGKLDIGPIPKSTRLKAVKVADFNFYDPIMRVNASN